MATEQSYDERALLQLLSEGSQYAFTRIFDRYKDAIYCVACRLIKSPSQAEEIVQDVFMKVWIKREEIVGVYNLQAFLFTVARNLTLDRLKRTAYDLSLQGHLKQQPGSEGETDQRVIDSQIRTIVREAVEKLPPRQRRVYILARELGYKTGDIAREMSISKLTAKKHLRLALQFLRQYLRDHLDR